jgi:hypothetical protein
MVRSTRDIVDTQVAGLVWAALVAVALLLAGTADAACLRDACESPANPLDAGRLDVTPFHPEQDGTLEIGAYLAASVACQAMTACLGVPISVGSYVTHDARMLSWLESLDRRPALKTAPSAPAAPQAPAIPSVPVATLRTHRDQNRTPVSGHR